MSRVIEAAPRFICGRDFDKERTGLFPIQSPSGNPEQSFVLPGRRGTARKKVPALGAEHGGRREEGRGSEVEEGCLLRGLQAKARIHLGVMEKW